MVGTPEEGPRIVGLLPEYNVGETVNANCTSSKMKSYAQLVWYINEEQVNHRMTTDRNSCMTFV
jgi:hypothetical protein